MRSSVLVSALALSACSGDLGIAGAEDFAGDGAPNPIETPVKTDRIVQVTKPKVDVLWVIDDSCSMVEEQAKLANNFDDFVKFFLDSGLDWHIGLISTDTEDRSKNGKLEAAGGYRYIDSQTPNPTAVFRQMSSLGTDGAFTERGLLAAYRGLATPSQALQRANEGFYRDEAALHVIVVSDEDDQSAPEINRFEFIDFMQSLKDDEDTPVTFSSIVGPQPAGCSVPDTNAVAGGIYINVTNQVGGIFESICERDWVPVLEDLGLQAAGLRREYFLSEVPVPGTISSWIVDGSYQLDGINAADIKGTNTISQICEQQGLTACFPFEYDAGRNSIILTDYVPTPLAEVYIEYEVLSGLQPEAEDGFIENPKGDPVDTSL